MRLCVKSFAAPAVLLALLALPSGGPGDELHDAGRNAAAGSGCAGGYGGRLAVAVAGQDEATLKAALLPPSPRIGSKSAKQSEAAATLMKGGQIQLRDLYLLDATSLAAPAGHAVFLFYRQRIIDRDPDDACAAAGRYAVVLANAAGAPYAGQLGFILVWSGPESGWKLGGLTVRPGSLDGHDGVWWWTRAREFARDGQPWERLVCLRGSAGCCLCRWIFSPRRIWRSWGGAGADQGFSAECISVDAYRWPAHVEDRRRAPGPDAVARRPGRGLRIDRSDRSGSAAHGGYGRSECVAQGANRG